MDTELTAALVLPLLAALLFRVPRRTLLLAKETEVLERLTPRSSAHRRLKTHIEDLVEREIDANENWLLFTGIIQWLFFFSYALMLVLVGFNLGGAWLILAAIGIAIMALMVAGTVARLLPDDNPLKRWLRAKFRA